MTRLWEKLQLTFVLLLGVRCHQRGRGDAQHWVSFQGPVQGYHGLPCMWVTIHIRHLKDQFSNMANLPYFDFNCRSESSLIFLSSSYYLKLFVYNFAQYRKYCDVKRIPFYTANIFWGSWLDLLLDCTLIVNLMVNVFLEEHCNFDFIIFISASAAVMENIGTFNVIISRSGNKESTVQIKYVSLLLFYHILFVFTKNYIYKNNNKNC